ncbi:MAG TPA: 16S rRNA (adenine(1518)-N(6)/adenine(1519)-N(6))-dimethyltransferase RsmA [Tahibacter sp.]|uniref:16S rRNA (adenine(1518)-N(6)/adenine(1519)-N(6))- dimethyltransferase RsmA n=1 Tax=Tahibacter sp. TaxID=2056211 RepID=UPI002CD013D1|nr:16S rRNA (adenine(1518)-N(6)/adenine(1519)-N(6))-dimethyltransferase RsmA [Tahibacter sp.]HSX62094.1 16S rRNA (adenine(1518)-N(6)/adenine(1519)-N(6))-dimethyltransferase RsmA [Tahibacter sp.]
MKRYPSVPVNAHASDAVAGKHVHKKQFGQHFLHDPGLIRRIVQAIAPKPGERLVEIGPGEGAITLPLLREHGRLTVIELDRDLIPRIQAAARDIGELEVIHADVLTVDFTALAAGANLRLVGNLPYNISSPILFHCLDHAAAITDMHFMLQKEVVDRMAADPGSKVYGRLSVMLQLYCRVEPLLKVPPGAFNPPPKVDSAVVRLTPLPRERRHDADPALVERVVRHAFGQRRKTLSNALHGVANADQIRAAGIDPKERAEQLAPMDFVAIAKVVAEDA